MSQCENIGRSQELHFLHASVPCHTIREWKSCLQFLGQTAEHRFSMHKQTSAHICGARWELEILFLWPQAAGQEERRGKARKIFVFSFGNVSAQKSWGSVRAFVGTRRAPVEEARSRVVCSFRTSKPIHLKMWPLPFWLPHWALDSPVLFKRKALLGWGLLKCIPWSAVSQKMCPSWLCSVPIVPTVIFVPIGWVREVYKAVSLDYHFPSVLFF